MKIISVILCLLSISALPAIENSAFVEHQIRLCDSEQEIINKLTLNSAAPNDLQKSEFKTYYIETIKRDYESTNWSIRVRVKSNKTEITVKKKSMAALNLASKYPNMICEYDLHGSEKDYSCKIDANISTQDFYRVLKKEKNWLDLLDSSQYNFLNDNNAILKNAVIYGSLIDQRFRWNDNKFGLVTLDLIHQDGHQQNMYHEISIRYPSTVGRDIGIQFINSVRETGIVLCSEQTNYPSKFDSLEVLNIY